MAHRRELGDASERSIQDDEEQAVMFKTIDSFYQYRHQVHYNTTHLRRRNFYALPQAHQEILSTPPFNIRQKFNLVDEAIDNNAIISECILRYALKTMSLPGEDGIIGDEPWQQTCEQSDLIKASTTVNQFYRDWSEEGEVERITHFEPVLKILKDSFRRNNKMEIKVLVPGAGLGRLVFEICRAGFDVEGSEISYHALFASNWILNGLQPSEKYSLHPFVQRFSNQVCTEDQLLKLTIPDVHPGEELAMAGEDCGTMSMSAGDFVAVYQQPDQEDIFHAVATVFFLDTAPNVLRYIETIRHTLKDGGIWINRGPLLWHFETGRDTQTASTESKDLDSDHIPGIEEPGSIELTAEEVLHLVQMMGFEVVDHNRDETPVGYIQQQTSMVQSTYRVLHFVARKRPMADSRT